MTGHVAIQYVRFGDFTQADVFGNITGSFSAGEMVLVAGAGKNINERIYVGANLKLLSGNYESYNALGIGVDLGAQYALPS